MYMFPGQGCCIEKRSEAQRTTTKCQNGTRVTESNQTNGSFE